MKRPNDEMQCVAPRPVECVQRFTESRWGSEQREVGASLEVRAETPDHLPPILGLGPLPARDGNHGGPHRGPPGQQR
jgi:hypothetical protein